LGTATGSSTGAGPGSLVVGRCGNRLGMLWCDPRGLYAASGCPSAHLAFGPCRCGGTRDAARALGLEPGRLSSRKSVRFRRMAHFILRPGCTVAARVCSYPQQVALWEPPEGRTGPMGLIPTLVPRRSRARLNARRPDGETTASRDRLSGVPRAGNLGTTLSARPYRFPRRALLSICGRLKRGRSQR
jgi:hypothetical protein